MMGNPIIPMLSSGRPNLCHYFKKNVHNNLQWVHFQPAVKEMGSGEKWGAVEEMGSGGRNGER